MQRNTGALTLNLPTLPNGFEWQVKVAGNVITINAIRGVWWKDGYAFPNWKYSGMDLDVSNMDYDSIISKVQQEVDSMVDRITYAETEPKTREDALRHIAQTFAEAADVTQTLHLCDEENV
jgi:hypothetical protein